mgnify:CR=1 FL=1
MSLLRSHQCRRVLSVVFWGLQGFVLVGCVNLYPNRVIDTLGDSTACLDDFSGTYQSVGYLINRKGKRVEDRAYTPHRSITSLVGPDWDQNQFLKSLEADVISIRTSPQLQIELFRDQQSLGIQTYVQSKDFSVVAGKLTFKEKPMVLDGSASGKRQLQWMLNSHRDLIILENNSGTRWLGVLPYVFSGDNVYIFTRVHF